MNAIITGASRGIGLELVREALAKGDRVLAVARRPEQSAPLMELADKYSAALSLCTADLNDVESPGKIFAAAGDVDILINNAGIFRKGVKREDFDESFHVNSFMPFAITQALLPKLRKSASPRVVQVTSLMGSIEDNGSGGSYAYRASKAALNMLNKCLAVENDWLTTIVIHPGWVETDMGGKGASVKVPDSAAGIWKVARALKKSDSGKFFDFRGENLPW